MKKVLTITLVLVFVVLMFVGCIGKPAKKDEVEVTLWLSPMWKGVISGDEDGANFDSFFKYAAKKFIAQYDKYDVSINVEVIPGEQRDEKLSTSLRTGSQPDIIFEGVFTVGSYAHEGVFVPLDDIVDEAARADIPAAYWEGSTFGNKIYMYPFYHMPGTLVYNADLFRQCGLDSYIGETNEIKT